VYQGLIPKLWLSVLCHKASFKSVMTNHNNGTAKKDIYQKLEAKEVYPYQCQQPVGRPETRFYCVDLIFLFISIIRSSIGIGFWRNRSLFKEQCSVFLNSS
jgi:hypothetical protein